MERSEASPYRSLNVEDFLTDETGEIGTPSIDNAVVGS